ncbi:related to transcription factor Pig1p [Cephalotrichum gorgonifer]|uniref:Related to transcription factor Pig1p n=1 Tax=Cephalotrichum gorgonifer TaxID=2041049 RepID=A0AAE8MQ73_9PEZI|nr:related to transcription factor Pig1p [Cephalotrichum gorgonifer]
MTDGMHLLSQHSPEHFSSPGNRIEGMDDMLPLGGEFVAPDAGYQDLLMWSEYPLELDMYPNQMQLVSTPLPTSLTELSAMSSGSEPMTSTPSRGSVHTSSTSIMSSGEYESMLKPMEMPASTTMVDGMIPEFDVLIAAESAWPMARCNPPIFSGSCPRTAIVHLECLEQKSKEEGTWASLEKYLEQVDWAAADLATVVPMTPRTRDKMLAITQSFLHKALDIHRGGLNSYQKNGFPSPGNFNFIVLPPTEMLEYFLRSYIRSLSSYFNLVIGGCVDPNEMLINNQASTLLVLLMIAQGASAVPMPEARYLAAGLTETCRISLFDVIEKNVEFSADPVALRCALLFTILGAWSGDKWLMDIAMGQRGMYLAMLKHAGMLEPQVAMIPTFDGSTNPELQWRTWLHRELQYRLVYNWVMVDQELGLFHDTAPILAISDLQCPLPGSDALWMATSVEEWSSNAQKIYGCSNTTNAQMMGASPISHSLCDLFQDFLHDNLGRRQSTLTPMQMRLLLHPLQSLLCHIRQMLSCFSDVLSARCSPSRSVTKASTQLRLEEAQGLLQKWYEMSMAIYKSQPGCYITRCNLVLYHLISLNAVTNFPEIERLARREGFDGSYWDLAVRQNRCVSNREESIFHSGQVMRLVRCMAPDRRPSWWSAAIYRATLILWIDSVSRLDPNFQKQQIPHSSPIPAQRSSTGKNKADAGTDPDQAGASPRMAPMSGEAVAIDQVTPEDSSIIAYLWSGDGVAVLTRPDGTTFGLDKPSAVLSYGMMAIEEGVSTRIGDGLKRKLVTLGSHWNVDGLGPVSG